MPTPITCHNCQTENYADNTHCFSCGTRLSQTLEMRAVDTKDEETAMSDNLDIQAKLDQTNMLESFESEGDVKKAKTASDDDKTYATTKMPNMDDEDGLLHIGSVRFRGNLVLKDKENNTEYRIENDQLTEALIGRLDIETGFRPLIDFTDENGKERGVSRRHATINLRGDLIFVTDHNSLNGTFLNGQRLVPEQSRVMRDADSLRIGHISLTVIFENA